MKTDRLNLVFFFCAAVMCGFPEQASANNGRPQRSSEDMDHMHNVYGAATVDPCVQLGEQTNTVTVNWEPLGRANKRCIEAFEHFQNLPRDLNAPCEHGTRPQCRRQSSDSRYYYICTVSNPSTLCGCYHYKPQTVLFSFCASRVVAEMNEPAPAEILQQNYQHSRISTSRGRRSGLHSPRNIHE